MDAPPYVDTLDRLRAQTLTYLDISDEFYFEDLSYVEPIGRINLDPQL